MIHVVYITEDNAVWGMDAGTFKKLNADWTAMSDTDKAVLLAGVDDGPASVDNLSIIKRFRVVSYWTGENAVGLALDGTGSAAKWTQLETDGEGLYQPECVVRAVPKPQVVVPRGLLPLTGATAIEGASIDAVTTGKAAALTAVTNDLKTYKVYDSESATWKDIDITDADAFAAGGMAASSVKDIPKSAWNEMGTGGIAFAYLLDKTDAMEECSVTSLSITLTMLGRWDKAFNGTDYYGGYTSASTLSVTFLKDGSYKINYTDPDKDNTAESFSEPIGLSLTGTGSEATWTYVDTKGDNLK